MELTLASSVLFAEKSELIEPGSFQPAQHYYPRVQNAEIHPSVSLFFRLSANRLTARYCHLHPAVDGTVLSRMLAYQPKFLRWAGCDLFHVATAEGARRMVVIETNSCPSGSKSMPLLRDDREQGAYRSLIDQSVLPMLRQGRRTAGALAVVFDKNQIEASGYAAALADATNEPVYLAPFPEGPNAAARVRDGTLEVRDKKGRFVPIRGVLRYVTQTPWNRIPVKTRTRIFNPTLACLAGGRNKLVASKAYEILNGEISAAGLCIRTPRTIRDVSLDEVPLWVARFGGVAVVKNPYSNAGQGVWTITSAQELEAFMHQEHRYRQFIVQALIGNYNWGTETAGSRYYHVGTVPNRNGDIFVADLRMMVCSSPKGFLPLALYARRAAKPIVDRLQPGVSSWEMLGTNLSSPTHDGGWVADTDRLLLVDRRDFNRLGMGLDDLIEGYIQTVLSMTAIDRMACHLATRNGDLRKRLFAGLNDDPVLLKDVTTCNRTQRTRN